MKKIALSLEIKDAGIISVVLNRGWVQTDIGWVNAKLTTEKSVKGINDNVINEIDINDTGNFLQWDGAEHPSVKRHELS